MGIIYVNGGYKSSTSTSQIQKQNEIQDERIERIEAILDGSDGTIDNPDVLNAIIQNNSEKISINTKDIQSLTEELSTVKTKIDNIKDNPLIPEEKIALIDSNADAVKNLATQYDNHAEQLSELNTDISEIENTLSNKQDTISDLSTIRQGAAKGATALQSYTEQYKGTVTGVKINGSNKDPLNGVVDLGTVITSHQDISGKQDTIADLETIRQGAAKGATSIQNISHLATRTELSNKVDKVSGKQLSTNDFTNDLKTKLENSNIYKHQFRTLSALPDSGDGWYSIASIGDTESSIVQISSGGHTDVQVAINTGWAGNTTGSLTVLNSFIEDTNDNHAYVKAVRLRKIPNSSNGTAVLEAKINRTGYYNYTQYVNIVVSVFTNAGHNIITNSNSQALQLVNDDSNIIQEFTLTDKAIMAKNIVAETITADNLQNYKTKQSAKSSPTASTSTAYQFIDTITQNANGEITATKKTVRSASQSQSGLMSASDKTKLDSFQSADTYATEEYVNQEISKISSSGEVLLTDVKVNGESVLTDKVANIDLSSYATEEWVTDKGYLTEHQSLDNYYTKDEINQQLGDINSILESIING